MPFVTITRTRDIEDDQIERMSRFLMVAVPEEMHGGYIEVVDVNHFDELALGNPLVRISIVGQRRRRGRPKRDARTIARNLKKRIRGQIDQGRMSPVFLGCDVHVILVQSIGTSIEDPRYDMR